MGPVLKFSCVSLLCLLVAACASPYQLSENASALRKQMTEASAAATLEKYVKPGPSRGGACVVSVTVNGMELDYTQPVKLSGSVIQFVGRYKVTTGSSVTGSVMGGTGQIKTTYEMRRAPFSVDAKALKEIVVLNKDKVKNTIAAWCRNVTIGYLVTLGPEKNTFPDYGIFTINVSDPADLDAVVAALSYLSPNAALKQ